MARHSLRSGHPVRKPQNVHDWDTTHFINVLINCMMHLITIKTAAGKVYIRNHLKGCSDHFVISIYHALTRPLKPLSGKLGRHTQQRGEVRDIAMRENRSCRRTLPAPLGPSAKNMEWPIEERIKLFVVLDFGQASSFASSTLRKPSGSIDICQRIPTLPETIG